MTDLIAVKNLLFSPVSKQDLLLFDRIAAPDLEQFFRICSDPARRADVEFLLSKGRVISVDSESALQRTKIEQPHMELLARMSILIAGIGAVIKSNKIQPPLTAEISEKANKLFNAGINSFLIHHTRLLALTMERAQKARVIPIVPSAQDDSTWSFPNNTRQLLSDLADVVQTLEESKMSFEDEQHRTIVQIAPRAFVQTAQEFIELPEARVTFDTTRAKHSTVIEVVLRNIPVPSETEPLEDVLSFVESSGIRSSVVRLRKWISEMARSTNSESDIQDELEASLSEYREHMRLARLDTQLGVIQTIIAVPLEVAEKILKIQWSKLPETLLSFRKRQLALMKAELEAPGREVAYIDHLQHRFAPRC